MAFFDENIINFFSILTIIANVIVLVFIADFIYSKITKKKLFSDLWLYSGKKAVLLSFIISLLAMVGSLLFSELLGFQPCVLCWYQRIMIYPIVFLSFMALMKKDKKIMSYIALLAFLGFLISGYHYYGQNNENSTLPCSALGYSQSCSESFFLTFGYITIPFMAFSATALILVLWFLDRQIRRGKV